MTLDTVFDLASLTKVVATTTAVMTLVEQGRLRLNDPVASLVPGFERYGKGGITDPPPADARVGTAARRRSRRSVDGLRRGDRAGERRSADRRRRASGSSTATSTSSCSATSSRASRGQPLDALRAARDVRAARHDRHRLPAAPSAAAAHRADRALRRRWTRGRASVPMRRRCAASCTIRRRGAWAASPGTPGCSAPRAICRASRACCSAAASWTAPRAVAADGRAR